MLTGDLANITEAFWTPTWIAAFAFLPLRHVVSYDGYCTLGQKRALSVANHLSKQGMVLLKKLPEAGQHGTHNRGGMVEGRLGHTPPPTPPIAHYQIEIKTHRKGAGIWVGVWVRKKVL